MNEIKQMGIQLLVYSEVFGRIKRKLLNIHKSGPPEINVEFVDRKSN